MEGEKLNRTGLACLAVVYVVWGSTYLAIRLAVREGAGFPPFTLGGLRVIVAGLALLLIAAALGRPLRPRRADLVCLLGSGLLLWPLANGLVTWGEQRADSGLAALLVGSMPIWIAIMESHLDRRLPSALLVAALLTGFAGVGLLAWPVLSHGARADVMSVLALLAAPITWGAGSIWQRRRSLQTAPLVASAWQQLFGGLGFALLAVVLREPRPTPTPVAWGAWAYLAVFGSIVAFTCYVQTLRLLPMNVTATYAYVNPVIAVVLGRLVLGEAITGWTLAGASLVILGVAGVFRDRARQARFLHRPDLAARSLPPPTD